MGKLESYLPTFLNADIASDDLIWIADKSNAYKTRAMTFSELDERWASFDDLAASVNGIIYYWIDIADRNAEVGMTTGQLGMMTNTAQNRTDGEVGLVYQYSGAAWVFLYTAAIAGAVLTDMGGVGLLAGGVVTMGQSAGPLLSFDDPNNRLILSGAFLSLGTPTGTAAKGLHIEDKGTDQIKIIETGDVGIQIIHDSSQDDADGPVSTRRSLIDGVIVAETRVHRGSDATSGYHTWWTNDAGAGSFEKMRLTQDGRLNVGIGSFETALINTESGGAQARFQRNTATITADVIAVHSSVGGGATNTMSVDADGSVHNITGTYDAALSDINVKDKFETAPLVLDRFRQLFQFLKTYEYTCFENPEDFGSNGRLLGIPSQDLEKLFPGVVVTKIVDLENPFIARGNDGNPLLDEGSPYILSKDGSKMFEIKNNKDSLLHGYILMSAFLESLDYADSKYLVYDQRLEALENPQMA